jgi:hypothetical protein
LKLARKQGRPIGAPHGRNGRRLHAEHFRKLLEADTPQLARLAPVGG